MAEWLLLKLDEAAPERCIRMLADGAGQPLHQPIAGTIAEAAADAIGRRVALLLSGRDVLLTEVALPARAQGLKPLQLVPYALEEHLASDVEAMHFALSTHTNAAGRNPVAAVDSKLLESWLASLRQAGVDPEIACPLAALVPENPGQVVVLMDGDTLYLRHPGQLAMSLPGSDVVGVLEAALGEQASNTQLLLLASQQDWDSIHDEVDAARERFGAIRVQLLAGGPLPTLAPQLGAATALNLLTGPYARTRTNTGVWTRWRLAAGLAAGLCVLHFIGLEWRLHRATRQLAEVDDAIATIAEPALAGDNSSGSVRQKIERRLRGQAGSDDPGLLAPLGAVAETIGSVKGLALQAVNYNGNAPTDMKIRLPDAETQQRFVNTMQGQGWSADFDSWTPVSGGFDGRVQLRRAGSKR